MGDFYEKKWLCKNLDARARLADFFAAHHGCKGPWEPRDVTTAFFHVKCLGYKGNDGTSVAAWRDFHQAAPEFLPALLNGWCGDAHALSRMSVTMRLKGKKTCRPSPKQIRAIMPLPPMLHLFDWMLSTSLNQWLDLHFPVPSSCYCGGTRGTQPADVSHGVALLLQRGADDRGRSAVAQADIATFYDQISPMRVAALLQRLGCPAWLVGGVTAFQLAVSLQFAVGDTITALPQRCMGSLTGSRVAGGLGRAIVTHYLREVLRSSRLRPYDAGGEALSFACWVDNVYAAGSSSDAAVANLMLFQDVLLRDWCLQFKDDSKTFISAMPRQDRDRLLHGWKWSSPFVVLGHNIGEYCSCREDRWQAERSVWARFWSGAGSASGRALRVNLRLKDIERVCWPSVAWRCTWWSLNRGVLGDVKSLQHAVVACCVRVPRDYGEDDAAFARHRARIASRYCARIGCWAKRIAAKSIEWSKHVERGRVRSWASVMARYRGSAWLQARRMAEHPCRPSQANLTLGCSNPDPTQGGKKGLSSQNMLSVLVRFRLCQFWQDTVRWALFSGPGYSFQPC